MSPKKKGHGDPNIGVWLLAQRWGQNRCCYCRGLFTEQDPPTKDHIYKNGDRGADMSTAIVLACKACNNARGQAPYDEYMAAVAAEWTKCDADKHPYRRPKYRGVPGGGHEITTESKNAARRRQAQTRQAS